MRRITFNISIAVVTLAVGLLISFLTSSTQSPATTENLAAAQPIRPAALTEVDSRWVYINQDVKWSAPRGLGSVTRGYSESENARLLVFFPGGRFASVSCLMLHVEGTSKMLLIPDEHCVVYKGTWSQNSSTITATSYLHKIAAPLERERPVRIEVFSIRKPTGDRLAGEIEMNGNVFGPSPSIEDLSTTLFLADLVD